MAAHDTPHRSRLRVRDILAHPVRQEARALLALNWASLAPALRVPQQMYGRQGNGCGATIGAMPRCDFACRGCYLNAEANRIPAEPVEAIKAQMRQLRPILGHAGNLQLTDGEVTLRPVEEVIELLQYARSLDLIPMLMTHGDSFRRRPGLLERLMVEGGLTEVSIHVDTTQRGRVGEPWRSARTEAALNPLRAEFARMIEAASRSTGLPLRAATTMTVTRENLHGVADVVRWLAAEGSPAFRMISFQPIAQVGRTEDGFGGGVNVDVLWDEIARGMGLEGGAARMDEMGVWFGHRACNRMVNGLVVRDAAQDPRYLPLRDERQPHDVRAVDEFLSRFGGISFRLDTRLEAFARVVGVLRAAPAFVAARALPYLYRRLRDIGRGSALRALWRLARGHTSVSPLVVVSHHFMSREEILTPLGAERLAHCVFQVPVNGELVSMCEVNALGIREEYYAQLQRRRAVGSVPQRDAPNEAPVFI